MIKGSSYVLFFRLFGVISGYVFVSTLVIYILRTVNSKIVLT